MCNELKTNKVEKDFEMLSKKNNNKIINSIII